jgi:hypothetical protein
VKLGHLFQTLLVRGQTYTSVQKQLRHKSFYAHYSKNTGASDEKQERVACHLKAIRKNGEAKVRYSFRSDLL